MFHRLLENRFPLGFFPTPLHPLARLTEKYPGYRLFIKRDDQTGLASGGNKTRKLEYFIRQALDSGCDTLITAGAQQSNHCRQTAAACAVAGLDCHVLLGGTQPPVYEGNLLLIRLLGATIHFSGENRKGEDIPALRTELEDKGRKCFIVPYGGSDPIGALGYVAAVLELTEQLNTMSLSMDYIFFATSSGGTQAGFTLGMQVFGLNADLMPVNIDREEPRAPSLETRVAEIAGNGARLLGLEKEFSPAEIRVLRGYDSAGYGVVTDAERTAIGLLASTEGIILDPVYTGRAFHAMLDHLERKLLKPGSNVLFWHTGGFPATFYYNRELI